jgi:hypothetical protein
MPSTLFVLTFTENLDLHQEVRGDAISFLKEHFLENFLGLMLFQPLKLK